MRQLCRLFSHELASFYATLIEDVVFTNRRCEEAAILGEQSVGNVESGRWRVVLQNDQLVWSSLEGDK